MGLFSSKKPAPTPEPPPRRRKVIDMIKADMDLEDAIDRDDDAAWRKAKAGGDRAARGATPAEIKAASEGAERAAKRWSW